MPQHSDDPVRVLVTGADPLRRSRRAAAEGSQEPPTPETGRGDVTYGLSMPRMYAFNVVNEYTAIGGVSRTHDSNGNLTDDGTYLFGYDYRNRLIEVKNKGTGAVIATYKYDALGRRVEKAVTAGATTRFVLDGVQAIEEFDATSLWQARYVYEDSIDQPRAMDRADIADVNGNGNTTEVLRFHYHQQALGSVTEMTDPTGAVVEWVTYDVYGQPTIRNQTGGTVTTSAIGNPYLYTGREYDQETGLYFYRARTYDPSAGRFLQRDPLGFVDGMNFYSYAQDSAATHSDPMGLQSRGPLGAVADLDVLSPLDVPNRDPMDSIIPLGRPGSTGPPPSMPPASSGHVWTAQARMAQWFSEAWWYGLAPPEWLSRYRVSKATVYFYEDHWTLEDQWVVQFPSGEMRYELWRVDVQWGSEERWDDADLPPGNSVTRQLAVYEQRLRGQMGVPHGESVRTVYGRFTSWVLVIFWVDTPDTMIRSFCPRAPDWRERWLDFRDSHHPVVRRRTGW